MNIHVNNFPHLLFLRIHERDRDIVAFTHIINQHRHIVEFRDGGLEFLLRSGIVRGAEIESEGSDGYGGVRGADLGGEGVEF